MPCKFCQLGNCTDPTHTALAQDGILQRILGFVPPNERASMRLVNQAFRDAQDERLKTRIEEAHRESARRMEDALDFGARRGATLLCWIDQGNDVVLVKAKELGKRTLQDGLCLALALEWIRAGLRGELASFRRDLTKRIPDRAIHRRLDIVRSHAQIRTLQREHEGLASQAKQHRDDALRILDENPEPIPRELHREVDRLIKLVEDYTKLAEQKAVASTALSLQPYHDDMLLEDSGCEIKKLVSDGACSSLLTQVFGFFSRPGYYLLSFNVPGAGHAVAFRIDSASKCSFFDANTGEWTFSEVSKLRTFVTDCWQQLYADIWSATGTFSLWRYGSRAQPQKKDDNCLMM